MKGPNKQRRLIFPNDSFGRWVVIREDTIKKLPKGYMRHYLCLCSCGNTGIVPKGSLLAGDSQSCGCFRKEAALAAIVTHGMYKTRTYTTWQHMIIRCTKPSHPSYARYGGRGIGVCDRWLKFENFLADMGEVPIGLELDRQDNDQGYDRGNCRWATRRQQMQNMSRNNNVVLNGETVCLLEACRRTGIAAGSVYYRMTSRKQDAQTALDGLIAKRRDIRVISVAPGIDRRVS